MSKGGSPAAPDYAGAAREQGQANIQAAIAQNIMGRPNLETPFGSTNYQQTGTTDVGGNAIPTFTGTQTLSPELKGMYDRAFSTTAQPFDVSQIPGIDKNAVDRNSVRDALVARQEESIGRDRENVRSDLIARGIPEGSQAFNNEMARLDRMTVDARQQAELGAGQAQQQALEGRRQSIQEALLNRQLPINELNALMQGGMMGTPQFGGGGSQAIQPPDIMGATQNQYGAAVDQANFRNAQQGQNTAAAASIIAAFMMSDIRLKSNIVRVGTHPLGIGVYEYDIEDRRERGVMAQELRAVMPEAVATMPNGYLGVNYSLIGGRP